MIQFTVRRPALARQAAKLTLGVWAFTLFLFFLPNLVAEGRIPNFVVGYVIVDIVVGIILSGFLYAAAARVAEASLGRKIIVVSSGVCIAALLFSLFDSWLGPLAQTPRHSGQEGRVRFREARSSIPSNRSRIRARSPGLRLRCR